MYGWLGLTMTRPARAKKDIKWSHTCLALTSYRMTRWQLCCIAYQDMSIAEVQNWDPINHQRYCMRGKEEARERGGAREVGGVQGEDTHRRDMARRRGRRDGMR